MGGPQQNGVTDGATNGVNGELDALILGAGFGGTYLLHRLRQEGFNVKIAEAGKNLGGVWNWNTYPGARVDSQYPIYAYNIPEVYNTWTWTEQFPGSEELRAYFAHVDKVLDISKDVYFNTRITAATWDEARGRWQISCENGRKFTAKFFHCCMGFAAARHMPDWPSLENFAGELHHSSFWPEGGVDVKGKRVGSVGTGATGIQLAQTVAPEAAALTVFQRTPNFCCPMRQAPLDPEQVKRDLPTMAETMKRRHESGAGFLYNPLTKNLLDETPEEREKHFEEVWKGGGFRMLIQNYPDIHTNPKANRIAYDFWARKTRARISDPQKRDILAPLEPPHAWGGKRLSLEQDFYEQMDKPHVSIIDVKANPVSHVVPEGIVTQDGQVHAFDVLAIATGFDSLTGGFNNIDFTGVDGMKLRTKWADGCWTYLGMCTQGLPNFFFTYGPQSPCALSNGPSITEPQSEWIVDVMKRMREAGQTRIEPLREAEVKWKEDLLDISKRELKHYVPGILNGGNVPGKAIEPLNYPGGIPLYLQQCRGAVEEGFRGFDLK
ncbi:hypothetical protein MBLNU230_g7263t1 [Neophaeotheca triangularis]